MEHRRTRSWGSFPKLEHDLDPPSIRAETITGPTRLTRSDDLVHPHSESPQEQFYVLNQWPATPASPVRREDIPLLNFTSAPETAPMTARFSTQSRTVDQSGPSQPPLPFDHSNDDRSQSNVQALIDAMYQLTSQLNSRPVRPIDSRELFNGDPLRYKRFVRHFDAYTARGVVDKAVLLDLLISSCTGEARECIADCILARTPELGYFEARRILELQFGQEHSIVTAHVNGLTGGPPLRSNDHSAISQLARDMRNCEICCAGMESAGLNTQHTISSIFKRLPRYLQDKFVSELGVQFELGEPATFAQLSSFIQRRAQIERSFLGQILNRKPDKSSPQNPPASRPVRGYTVNTTTSAVYSKSCPRCSAQHSLWKCEDFLKLDVASRWTFVKLAKLCFNCLGNHVVRNCKSDSRCRYCQKQHHSLLHRDKQSIENLTVSPQSENGAGNLPRVETNNDSCASYSTGLISRIPGKVRLKVIPVRVWGASSRKCEEVYAFLDEGSDTTLCTAALINRLGVKGKSVSFSLSTVGGSNHQRGHEVNLSVQGLGGMATLELVRVLSVPHLPKLNSSLPSASDLLAHSDVLQGVSLPQACGDVELLIGADVPEAHRTLEYRISQVGGPNSVRTPLGWCLVGPDSHERLSDQPIEYNVNFIQSDNAILHKQMQRMYESDFVCSNEVFNREMSLEDRKALSDMEQSVCIKNGHFQVSLPWKSSNPALPNNKVMAMKRLRSLQRRLSADSSLHRQYCTKMSEYLDSGFARKIPPDELTPSPRTWYLPHHSTGPKFRVVFDCAAKYQGTSLNDQLLQGPDQTSSLLGVLLRFRLGPIAVMADIKAMFHQVRAHPRDCDSLRFMWWPDGDLSRQPEEYQMVVHLFGATSSPSICGFALRKTASSLPPDSDPSAREALLKSFYVDDFLRAFQSVAEATSLIKVLCTALKTCGFNLTKFTSNNSAVLKSIPASDVRPAVEMTLDSSVTERALGVNWNPDSDDFRVRVDVKEKALTRRGILSTVSQCYDPMGFIQPALLPAKQLLQELCILGLDWDDPIPLEFQSRWLIWLECLKSLQSARVPRNLLPLSFKNADIRLHCFCDASQSGYGAVLFLRAVGKEGQVHCSFVLSRSRVAPVKPRTIPRMELVAAVIGAELSELVMRELNLPKHACTFWADSTSVLRYITGTARRYKTFVANRVGTIQSVSSPHQWRHVPSADNPADIASRGISPDKMPSQSQWFSGPRFLQLPEHEWPKTPDDLLHDPNDCELKRESHTHATSAQNTGKSDFFCEYFEHFSSFDRLRKAFAWLYRWKIWLINKRPSTDLDKLGISGPLAVDELNRASSAIVRIAQSYSFYKELSQLQDHKDFSEVRHHSDKLKNSSLRKLAPIQVNGIIHVGGRLQRSALSESHKHPIILPSNSHVTYLLIMKYHVLEGHAGPLHTLAALREQFWVIKGHSAVRKVLRHCSSCHLRNIGPGKQQMSPLPEFRVSPGKPPFTFCGLDYAGPFLVKVQRTSCKRYICLFTCLSTRAIHLEPSYSLTSDSFLLSFQRFVSRRCTPEEIYCDNGTNFVGGAKEIDATVRAWNAKLGTKLAQRGVRFHFNPPAASHQGGVWERLIRSVRKTLTAIMNGCSLDDEKFCTFLAEAERIINNRPITPVSSDARDLEALTPASLLKGAIEASVPPGVFCKADGYRKSWRLIHILADQFWSRWKREYLSTLQVRQKWFWPTPNFAAGDLVLVVGENTPRGVWPKAIVEKVFPGKDGNVRSCRVRTTTGSLVRDIRKLCLVEGAL